MSKTQTVSAKKVLEFDAKEISKAVAYIENMWLELTVTNAEDDGTLIGLPFPYVVPSRKSRDGFAFREMYYWDSYFIAKGLLVSGHYELAEGMLENLLNMYKRFHIIPNASRFYMTGRSQPPILTSYIFDVYESLEKSSEWLREKIEIAEREYRDVWTATEHPNSRNVFNGLSRYYDINYLDDLAEAESGWDMTTRFAGHCLNYIPVDLNCLLYKYEADFARAYEIFGDIDTKEVWLAKAQTRAEKVTEYLWDEPRGFFFDYNFESGEHSEVFSLASYYALWSGLATNDQAERLVAHLGTFDKIGGLSTTDSMLSSDSRDFNKQWAYPNAWAPLQFIVIKGLEKYEHKAVAKRLARKWLKTNLDYYKYFGVFREAYNAVDPLDHPVEGVYPSQTGFGWTNGVFLHLANKFLSEDEKSLI